MAGERTQSAESDVPAAKRRAPDLARSATGHGARLPAPAGLLLSLQQTAGNRAVRGLLQRSGPPRRRAMSSPGVIQREPGDGKEVLDDLTNPEWMPHGAETFAGKKAITGAELKLLMKVLWSLRGKPRPTTPPSRLTPRASPTLDWIPAAAARAPQREARPSRSTLEGMSITRVSSAWLGLQAALPGEQSLRWEGGDSGSCGSPAGGYTRRNWRPGEVTLIQKPTTALTGRAPGSPAGSSAGWRPFRYQPSRIPQESRAARTRRQ